MRRRNKGKRMERLELWDSALLRMRRQRFWRKVWRTLLNKKGLVLTGCWETEARTCMRDTLEGFLPEEDCRGVPGGDRLEPLAY